MVPSRKFSGGSTSVILTRRVRVARSAWGAISRTCPLTRVAGSASAGHDEAGLRTKVDRDLVRHIDHSLALLRANHAHHFLPRLKHLTDFGFSRGNDAVELGMELCVAELFLRDANIRPRRFRGRLGAFELMLSRLEIRFRVSRLAGSTGAVAPQSLLRSADELLPLPGQPLHSAARVGKEWDRARRVARLA